MKKTFFNDDMTYNQAGLEFEKELEFLFPLAEKYIKLDYNVSEIRDFVNQRMNEVVYKELLKYNLEKYYENRFKQ